jgi:AraC-like DNA-binding protein
MERAGSLLRHSDLSVGAVAISVGFEDTLYFSRAFRKFFGASPSDYRAREMRR